VKILLYTPIKQIPTASLDGVGTDGAQSMEEVLVRADKSTEEPTVSLLCSSFILFLYFFLSCSFQACLVPVILTASLHPD